MQEFRKLKMTSISKARQFRKNMMGISKLILKSPFSNNEILAFEIVGPYHFKVQQ